MWSLVKHDQQFCLLTRDPKKLRAYDIKLTEAQKRRIVAKNPPPPFELGLGRLGIHPRSKKPADVHAAIKAFVDDWFNHPQRYLSPQTHRKVTLHGGFLSFQSLLDKTQTVRFKYDPQPKGTPGRKVALIHIMHWNGRLEAYDSLIQLIRSNAFPISTLIHVPAYYKGMNPTKDCDSDYCSVGTNPGEMVFSMRQDIVDVVYIARYLKERLGYDQVGLYSYSVGTPRAFIAAAANPCLFDFGIFHMLADDFTEAFMHGVSTRFLADSVRGKVSERTLKLLWKTMSPGAYHAYFKNLPPAIRVIQANHDWVFLSPNVRRINSALHLLRPDIRIDMVDVCHNGFGSFPRGWKILYDNLRFIYERTPMHAYKRRIFFPRLPKQRKGS